MFTFGDTSFSRRGYKKDGVWCYPVDNKLGLSRYERHSKELMFQIAKLSTIVTYRQVVEIVQMMYNLVINHETVRKAVQQAHKLQVEFDEYRYYQDHEEHKKIKAPFLYIEGDGVMVKTTIGDNKRTDLAHFVIHTGSRKVENTRWELQNKREIISTDYLRATERLEDILYNDYEINGDTVLITNSDGGHGYSPHFFTNRAKMFHVTHHDHYWDMYHLNEKIKSIFRNIDQDLQTSLITTIKTRQKKNLPVIFDTAEALCESEEQIEELLKFKRKLTDNFRFTSPSYLKGYSHHGIGIMELQHRKVTYRMKNRGMYWSKNGAETMSQMILQNHEGRLRNLFFGPWKEEFQLIKDLSKVRHLIKKRGTVSSIASANLLRSGILKGEVVK